MKFWLSRLFQSRFPSSCNIRVNTCLWWRVLNRAVTSSWMPKQEFLDQTIRPPTLQRVHSAPSPSAVNNREKPSSRLRSLWYKKFLTRSRKFYSRTKLWSTSFTATITRFRIRKVGAVASKTRMNPTSLGCSFNKTHSLWRFPRKLSSKSSSKPAFAPRISFSRRKT